MPTRNPVVRHGAVLRKGGVHTESVSGQRHQSRRALDEEIDEYFELRNNPDPDTQLHPTQEVIDETEAGKPASSSLTDRTCSIRHILFSIGHSPQLLQTQRNQNTLSPA